MTETRNQKPETRNQAYPHAAGYIRVSTQVQVKGQSPAEQTARIRAAASARKVTLINIFQDMGVSGDLEIYDRPGLRDLIESAGSGNYSQLLITRWDRLSRELLQTLIVENQLTRHGVEIIAVDQDTGNLDESTAALIRNILAAVSQFDKALTVKKLAAGKRRKVASGIGPACGPPAFGFAYTGPRGARILEKVPSEQQTILLIRRLRREKLGFRRIADILNGNKPWRGENLSRPTRRGGAWHPQTVQNAVESNHARGRITWQGESKRLNPTNPRNPQPD